MISISAQADLPMPTEPISIAYAPISFDSDPLVRYDGSRRAITLDAAWDESNPDHRARLAEHLTIVLRDAARAVAVETREPQEAAIMRDAVAINRSR